MGSIYKPTLKSGGESGVWWISYYSGSKRIRESSGTENKKQAETLLKEREGRVATGQAILPRGDKVAYEEIRDDLLTYYAVNGTRNVVEAKVRLAHLDPYFAGRRVVSITSDEIERYKKSRQAEAGPATINREVATLSRMLRLAYRHGKLVRVPVISRMAEPSARAGFVTHREFNDIVRYLSDSLRVGGLIAFTLGWRKREVFDLQRRQLDLEAGTLSLDPGSTKNGEGRVAHLTPGLRDALADQVARVVALERRLGRVIPEILPHLTGPHAGLRVGDIRKAWGRACRQAGRPGILFHDLRRSAVRNMEQAGISRSVAMKITGHKTESVYRRYAIVSAADLKQAAAKLATVTAAAR